MTRILYHLFVDWFSIKKRRPSEVLMVYLGSAFYITAIIAVTTLAIEPFSESECSPPAPLPDGKEFVCHYNTDVAAKYTKPFIDLISFITISIGRIIPATISLFRKYGP